MPTVETTELLYQPLLGFTNGNINDIPPYIIGTNKNEWGGFNYQSYQELETLALTLVEGDLEIAASILRFYNITETNFVLGSHNLLIFRSIRI